MSWLDWFMLSTPAVLLVAAWLVARRNPWRRHQPMTLYPLGSDLGCECGQASARKAIDLKPPGGVIGAG